jgi:hypothetical protein
MRFRQLGLTLVEGLAFLGVAASVLVGTMALYKIADTTQKTTDLQAGLLEMRRIANEYRLGYGSYTGFTHTLVINSNRVPGGWGVDTTNGWMTHQFNNGAVVASPCLVGRRTRFQPARCRRMFALIWHWRLASGLKSESGPMPARLQPILCRFQLPTQKRRAQVRPTGSCGT